MIDAASRPCRPHRGVLCPIERLPWPRRWREGACGSPARRWTDPVALRLPRGCRRGLVSQVQRAPTWVGGTLPPRRSGSSASSRMAVRLPRRLAAHATRSSRVPQVALRSLRLACRRCRDTQAAPRLGALVGAVGTRRLPRALARPAECGRVSCARAPRAPSTACAHARLLPCASVRAAIVSSPSPPSPALPSPPPPCRLRPHGHRGAHRHPLRRPPAPAVAPPTSQPTATEPAPAFATTTLATTAPATAQHVYRRLSSARVPVPPWHRRDHGPRCVFPSPSHTGLTLLSALAPSSPPRTRRARGGSAESQTAPRGRTDFFQTGLFWILRVCAARSH